MQSNNDLTALRTRVAEAWDGLLADDLSHYPGGLSALVVKAYGNGRLRVMFPFLSVGRLCFSRCTDYPYFVPVWIAPAGDGSFSVQVPANQGGWVDGKEIYRGSADDAVRNADEALTEADMRVQVGNAESLGLVAW